MIEDLARKAAACALALCMVTPAVGGGLERWTREGESFRVGSFDGMQLAPDGALIPALERVVLERPETSVLWDVLLLKERVFAAAGAEAGLIEVGAESESGVVEAQWSEPEVFALAESGGVLWFATGPSGAIYRLDRKGEISEFHRPEAEYIWDLLPRADGSLVVATGLPGRVIALDRKGNESAVLWEASDAHVRCLGAGADGTIYAGTAGSGLVAKLDGRGGAFVIWDSPRPETVALVVDDAARVWAAFSGGAGQAESGGTGEPKRKKVEGDTSSNSITVRARADDEAEAKSGEAKGEKQEQVKFAESSGGGEVVRIDADGLGRRVWRDGKETPMDLAGWNGGVLMATGSPARVWWFDREGRDGWWDEREDAEMVSAIHATDSQVVLATSKPTSIVLYGPKYEAAGRWTSDVLDAGSLARWGRLHATVSRADTERIEVLARSGNTSEPGEGWSEWATVAGAAEPPDGDGGAVDLPRARFFQVRIESRDAEAGRPALRGIEASYARINREPVVKEIDILPGGVAYRPVPPPAVTSGEMPIATAPHSDAVKRALGPAKTNWRSKKVFEWGAQTLTWKAGDPDGDRLEFSIEYCRDEGAPCTKWVMLKSGLTRTFYSFDAHTLADGLYRFRITASDRPGNVLGAQREGAMISTPLLVDHAPPSIEHVAVKKEKGAWKLSLEARDVGGGLALAEITWDQEQWHAIAPHDGMIDSHAESFSAELPLSDVSSGTTLTVRISDQSGNTTTRQLQVTQ